MSTVGAFSTTRNCFMATSTETETPAAAANKQNVAARELWEVANQYAPTEEVLLVQQKGNGATLSKKGVMQS